MFVGSQYLLQTSLFTTVYHKYSIMYISVMIFSSHSLLKYLLWWKEYFDLHIKHPTIFLNKYIGISNFCSSTILAICRKGLFYMFSWENISFCLHYHFIISKRFLIYVGFNQSLTFVIPFVSYENRTVH